MTAQFREMIGPLQGSCRGLRCYIVGTGPTMDDVNLSKLRGQYIMALNGAVLKFTNLRSYPDAWWVWYDARAYRELWSRVKDQWRRIQCIIHKKGMEDMRSHLGAGRYVEYVKDNFRASRTVAETAILLCQFLGFSEVVLVGIDGMQARDGIPYASGFEWKHCRFMTAGQQESCQKSSAQMVQAFEDLKEKLADRGRVPRIIQTSVAYPVRDQFEFVPFDKIVEEEVVKVGPTKPAKSHPKF